LGRFCFPYNSDLTTILTAIDGVALARLLLHHQNRPEVGLQKADQFIHHVQWLYPCVRLIRT